MTRVLVIDDQEDIRELLNAVLTLQGFDVLMASGGPRALDMLDAGTMPDLILLDVQMPDMDGWETLRSIRRRFGDDGPRVVMCTVKGHPRDLVHGWTSGCDGYIWKPFDMRALVDEIDAVLDRRQGDRVRVRRTAIGEAQMLLKALS